MSETETTNDHDLLIGLNAKVDSILERFTTIDNVEKRVRDLEIMLSGYKADLVTTKDEIQKLRTNNSIWSAANTLGGIILAVILGLFRGGAGG
jgi:hypothetical protein